MSFSGPGFMDGPASMDDEMEIPGFPKNPTKSEGLAASLQVQRTLYVMCSKSSNTKKIAIILHLVRSKLQKENDAKLSGSGREDSRPATSLFRFFQASLTFAGLRVFM